MKHETPINNSYAAIIVAVPEPITLEGLDNLVSIPVVGHKALTQKGKQAGDLAVAFTAETQLSEEYAYENSLHRHGDRNKDEAEKGYLEDNRRIKAIRMRGYESNALLMPLESLAYTGVDVSELAEGDTFDKLNGHDICNKYELPVKGDPSQQGKSKVERAFRRVDTKVFPEHLSTDQYGRNKHLLRAGREVVVTQKLHGTSIRVGRVPALRVKGRLEKFLNRWVPTADYEFDNVYGSRKVIKDINNPNQQHFYSDDIWTAHGKKLDGLIPDGYIVYAELIGWAGKGSPIQKGYTYGVPDGEAHLYVYRVAVVNEQGALSDLSWDGVREFCEVRGLRHTPEMFRMQVDELDQAVADLMDVRFADTFQVADSLVPLSSAKTVDEGVCLRQEGVVPVILKAKAPKFLEFETKQLDKGEVSVESAA